MQQIDSIQPISKVSVLINRVIRFFDRPRDTTPQSERLMTNIEWPDSDSEPSSRSRDNQLDYGGYNEAFIVQYWASYHSR